MPTIALQQTKVKAIDGSVRILGPQEYANEVLKKSKSSFYLPLIMLPKQKREAIAAVYAFCRIVDDEADKTDRPENAIKKLDFFQKQIDIIYQPETNSFPSHPVVKALAYHSKNFKLEKRHFDSIINGCRMDVEKRMYMPSLETLDEYCYRVSSAVGLLSIEVFGYTNYKTREFAINLGKFMQLINILRDVVEDARKGRIYLPQEILQQCDLGNITTEQIINDPSSAKLRMVYGQMAGLAQKFLEQAFMNLSQEDYKNMRPALFMKEIYINYMQKMESCHWDFKPEELTLSLKKKLKIAGDNFSITDLFKKA